MTVEDRVRALAWLRLTPRQTRFLTLVALHSGYCVRRQYQAFAGIQYGKNVRGFLDGLVRQGWAARFTYRPDRGHVYHVRARAIYRAIGQEDNRNRRVASPPLIGRKLMLLDFALEEPAVEWCVTEDDKVQLFSTRYGVATADLPQRMQASGVDGDRPTVRYFPHKLPIYLAGVPPVPHFVYLAVEPSTKGFEQFLRDHGRLCAQLPTWTLVCVRPAHLADLSGYERAFGRYNSASGDATHGDRLARHFATRRLVEQEQVARLSVKALYEYRQVRRLYAGPGIERQYARWLATGGTLEPSTVPPPSGPAGCLVIRTLAHPYQQVGSMAGVA